MSNLFRNTARFYDLDNRDNLTADIPFYLDYAQKYGGDVLELGCGTGRVSIFLAQAGHHVTGLDLSEEMLGVFSEKRSRLDGPTRDRISIVNGSMSNFHFQKKFNLIITPFRAFQALTEEDDISNSLSLIRAHLAEDGVFIINVFRPNEGIGENWRYPETIQWERQDEGSGCRILKKHWGERIDLANQVIYPHFAYEITHPDGLIERTTESLALKYYYHEQLKERLTNAHFVITEEFGWYDKSPIQTGRELILVCRTASMVS